MEGDCKAVTRLVSDRSDLYIELPVENIRATYGKERLRLIKSKYDDFMEQMTGWYDEYLPLDDNDSYEDLVSHMREIATRNATKDKGTTLKKSIN